MTKKAIALSIMALACVGTHAKTSFVAHMQTTVQQPAGADDQTTAGAEARTTMEQLADALAGMTDYAYTAQFEALLPSAQDPVVYDVVLQSTAAPGDSLSPCDYLITWQTMSPAGPLEGFSAYFDGNHYRFRNNKLQEYHMDANPAVFAPVEGPGRFRAGVQQTAQFADLLPQMIGEKLAQMMQDGDYVYTLHPDTLVSGQRRIVVDGVKRTGGYDALRYSYVFDKQTMLPVAIEMENNPGSISEQIVSISYGAPSAEAPVTLSEEGLMARWPEVFEKFRQGTFRVESLVGKPLPEFSCQVLGGDDRYTRHNGETLPSATIIVAIDPSVATSQATIDAVRDALAMLPTSVDVLWAFNTNIDSEISALVAPVRTNETTLKSASSLLRNCGITLYPTILIVDRTGTVKDVVSGYNKDIAEIVIQKISI